VTSVVFLPKCNFRCNFCHNHELVLNDKKFELVDKQAILDFLKENKEWIDGVTITGGEPTIHNEALYLFLKQIKNLGFFIKLDTNGTHPDVINKFIDDGLVDYIAMDIKTALVDDKYQNIINVPISVEIIKKTIDLIIKSGVDHEFRTTVVPGYVTLEDIELISKYITSAKLYVLQQFNPKETLESGLKKLKPYDESVLVEMVLVASKSVNTKMRLR